MGKMGRPARTPEERAYMKAMGERLLWVRLAMGKSQGEMGDLIGVTQSAWHLYEQGTRAPDQIGGMVRLIGKLKISRAFLEEGSLEGVERELAIRLAASHPELVLPTDKGRRTGTGRS